MSFKHVGYMKIMHHRDDEKKLQTTVQELEGKINGMPLDLEEVHAELGRERTFINQCNEILRLRLRRCATINKIRVQEICPRHEG